MATGLDVIKVAENELGVVEGPRVNEVKYNDWYYRQNVYGTQFPWCMAFVQWVYSQAGAALPHQTASCGELLRWYKKYHPECIVDHPVAGDIVIFDLPGGSATDHAGLFVRFDGDMILTIDGNTGYTNNSNGGQVLKRKRDTKYVAAYIHPNELQEDDAMIYYESIAEISKNAPWATEAVTWMYNNDIVRGVKEGDEVKGLHLSEDMLRMLVFMYRLYTVW